MAELIAITEGLVKTTTGTESQSLQNAVDVLRFDSLDLLVTAAFESPSYRISISTCSRATSAAPPMAGSR